MNDTEIRTRLLLSLQRALLGAVTPNLRAVSCGWKNKILRLRFVFDGEISEDHRDIAHTVGAEVIADFAQDWNIEENILRLDAPAKLTLPVDAPLLAFRRRET